MSELDKLALVMQAALSPVDKSAANPFFKSKYAPLPEVRDKKKIGKLEKLK